MVSLRGLPTLALRVPQSHESSCSPLPPTVNRVYTPGYRAPSTVQTSIRVPPPPACANTSTRSSHIPFATLHSHSPLLLLSHICVYLDTVLLPDPPASMRFFARAFDEQARARIAAGRRGGGGGGSMYMYTYCYRHAERPHQDLERRGER
ncbi:hypothetical protein BC628DRAFT_129218 [Trametes gibbosa]|nr:hypothetical protein BC628DRAFT_129218 [Trametes gibbosa]